jgi:dTDP-4-amino-4,6-dideoxygalactose transaminase
LNELRLLYGKKYVVLFPQARIALYAIMKSLLPKGAEVLIAAYNVPVVIEYLEAAGMKLKYVDSELGGFNVDVEKAVAALSTETRAVVISHMYGMSVDFSELISICKERGILIIEDVAQAFGSLLDSSDPRLCGNLCGTVGDVGVFSTGIFKKLSTLLGSFVVTDDRDIYEKLKSFKDGHRSSLKAGLPIVSAMVESFTFIIASNRIVFPLLFLFMKNSIHNVNMEDEKSRGVIDPDELPCSLFEEWQSTLGLRSLARFEETNKPFLQNSLALQERLSGEPVSDPALCNYLHYPVRIRNRRNAMNAINEHGYDVGPGKFFNYGGTACPIAETAVNENVNIPLHRGVASSGLERIADVIEHFQKSDG